jgi:hypothetical protein
LKIIHCERRRRFAVAPAQDVAMRARLQTEWRLPPLPEKKYRLDQVSGTSKFCVQQESCGRISKGNCNAELFVWFTGAELVLPYCTKVALISRRQKCGRRSQSLACAVGLRTVGEIVVVEFARDARVAGRYSSRYFRCYSAQSKRDTGKK